MRVLPSFPPTRDSHHPLKLDSVGAIEQLGGAREEGQCWALLHGVATRILGGQPEVAGELRSGVCMCVGGKG